jgi:hypothetical protein
MNKIAAVTLSIASLCLSAVCAAAAMAGEPAAGAVHEFYGRAVRIGAGSVRTVVEADAARRPVAIGLEFTAGVLKGLPIQPNARDDALDWHYYLWFPKAAPTTGFDHVLIDWHPHGHPPQGIYTFPHFDFHFYLISLRQARAIRGRSNLTGVALPANTLLPPGYFIPPAAEVVARMGLHAVAKAAPEFHGQPFTYTLIYGYDNGALAFLEPMITTAYLQTRPKMTASIPQPAGVSYTAYYPGRYSVAYDAGKQVYRVMLDRLQLRHAGGLASAH